MNIFTFGLITQVYFTSENPIIYDTVGRIRTYDFKILGRILEIPTQSPPPLQHNYFDWRTQDFVEDCVVILNRHWIHDFFTTDSKNLKYIKNKKIILLTQENCFSNLYYGEHLLEQTKKFLEDAMFDLKNVYVITQLHSDIPHIEKYLSGCNIQVLDAWLDEFMWFEGSVDRYIVENKNLKIEDTKRFSIFTRRMNERRLHFYCSLVENNVLSNSYYTFGNMVDSLSDRFTTETIKSMIPESTTKRELIEKWVDGIPYEIESGETEHFNHPETGYPSLLKNMFKKSDLHIVQETNPIYESSIISEKTYKAIFYKKPFVLLGQPNSLELLRIDGYKTFHPIIDESYDLIEDYELRKEAIIKEITRLNSLPDDEWKQVIDQCLSITEHNYNRLIEIVNEPWPESFTISGMSQF